MVFYLHSASIGVINDELHNARLRLFTSVCLFNIYYSVCCSADIELTKLFNFNVRRCLCRRCMQELTIYAQHRVCVCIVDYSQTVYIVNVYKSKISFSFFYFKFAEIEPSGLLHPEKCWRYDSTAQNRK